MSQPALRPTFRLTLPLPPAEAIETLQSHLESSGAPLTSQRAGHHMTVTVTPAVRHFWSPWLNLEFEEPTPPLFPHLEPPPEQPPKVGGSENENGTPAPPVGTSLHARFSPAPSLWTGYMVVYFTLASAGFFALMWALAQWTMGNPPTLLWAVAACGLGCGLMFWVSLIGQKLARDQMHLLRDAVESAWTDRPTPPAQP